MGLDVGACDKNWVLLSRTILYQHDKETKGIATLTADAGVGFRIRKFGAIRSPKSEAPKPEFYQPYYLPDKEAKRTVIMTAAQIRSL